MAAGDRLDLVVATPGVEVPRLRADLESLPECELVVDRATRCGLVATELTTTARLRVAVVPCAVSLHAAYRLQQRLESTRRSVDSVMICRTSRGSVARPLCRRLAARFECPVVVAPAADTGRRQPVV